MFQTTNQIPINKPQLHPYRPHMANQPDTWLAGERG